MPSLHDNGWRQGSVFDAQLTVVSYEYSDGEPVRVDRSFGRWVVASQDCDLATADSNSNDPSIEVIPALDGHGGGSWGIRSRTIRLEDDLHTDASLPKLRISPAALSVFLASARALDPARAVALKTWLGLRYDRPAVPTILVGLARAIAGAVKRTRSPELSAVTHDVLFGATEEVPSRFQLIGVVTDTSHAQVVKAWLASAALEVDPALGTLMQAPEVVTKDGLSLTDLENTYSADLSDITWSRSEPRGAT